MATIFYAKAPVQVEVGIYRETMLATDCSINFTSSQQPIYSVGKKGPLGQFPSAARVGDMSFSFLTSITGQFDNIEGAGNQSRQGNIINFLANGVKIRGSETYVNDSRGTFIYMAWAEMPFKYANAF